MIKNYAYKTYRGTLDEVLSHRSEIGDQAIVEIRVYDPEIVSLIDEESRSVIDLLQSWRDEDATDDIQELDRRDAENEATIKNIQSNRVAFDDIQTQ